jgi:hypothetical protein
MSISGNYRDDDCGANRESQYFSTKVHGCILTLGIDNQEFLNDNNVHA